MKVAIPRYQQIAIDVAAKIAEQYYPEGTRLYMRSSLASQYGVSSETARRAICILSDMKIVESIKGSGVVVLSREKAVKYVNQFSGLSQLSDLKKQIVRHVDEQTLQFAELKRLLGELVDKTEHFRAYHSFTPFEIEITDKARHIGENLSESKFWHNTTATVIAIMRGDKIIISPGPYAILTPGDMLYYIGDENCPSCVEKFLYGDA